MKETKKIVELHFYDGMTRKQSTMLNRLKKRNNHEMQYESQQQVVLMNGLSLMILKEVYTLQSCVNI